MSQPDALAAMCANMTSGRPAKVVVESQAPSGGSSSRARREFQVYASCPDFSEVDGHAEWDFLSSSLCNNRQDKLRLEFADGKLQRFTILCDVGSV